MKRSISLLALAAVLAASIANPAVAQRDTRPETRPKVELKGDGDSERPVIKLRLPSSTKGMICTIGEARNGISYVEVVNDTGKAIPAGSTLTIYTQPGNVQKQFKVEKDWKPGQKLRVPLKGVKFSDNEACSARISVAAPSHPGTEPQPEPQPEPEPRPRPEQQPEDESNKIEVGDTGPIELGDGKVISASCEITAQSMLALNNSGDVDWPAGAIFEVTLPNGAVFTYVSGGVVPGGDIGIPDSYYYPDGPPELGPWYTADFTCDIKVTLP